MRDAPPGVVFWARRRAPPLRSLALAEARRSGDERAQLEVAFCVYIVPRERGCPALPEGGGRFFEIIKLIWTDWRFRRKTVLLGLGL